MTYKEFKKLLEKIQQDELEISKTEDTDYGLNNDAQGCFKEIKRDIGLLPEISICIFIAKHWQIIKRYCSTGTVVSEDIIDCIINMRLYLAHLIAIIQEEDGDLDKD